MEMFTASIKKAAASEKPTVPAVERPMGSFTDPHTHEYHMSMIFDHTAHNHITLPVVIEKAEGPFFWDVTGKKYTDYLSSFCCANQGRGHPKILKALIDQAQKLAMSSLVTHHNMMGPASKYLTEKLGYEKILFMNSGAEAVDTAVLTSRRWGYMKKKIPEGKATCLFPKNTYWGMITSSRSGCDDPERQENVGPLCPESLLYDFVDYNNVEALEEKFKANPYICAYIFEPIQGHGGNIHPKAGYYKKIRELCDKYNVLMVADEVQCGLGRTGKLFTVDWENVRPDMITIGKSLAGDFMPISAVLADNEIMDIWGPQMHISSYAGNTVACAVAMASIEVLFEEKMIENSEKLGYILAEEFSKYNYPFIRQIYYGKGLFASFQMDTIPAWTLCEMMLERGILVKPDGNGFIKVMPPICIKEEDFRASLKIFSECIEEFHMKQKFENLL